MYHCVINEDNKVVNIVMWVGKSVWHPGPGLTAVFCPERLGSIGDTYDPETKTYKKS